MLFPYTPLFRSGGPAPSPWLGGLAVDWTQTSVPQAIRQAGGAVWAPYYRDLTEAGLREAQRLGLRVVVWTVNDPAEMASLIGLGVRSEEHTSELQSLMRISYAVFCLTKTT